MEPLDDAQRPVGPWITPPAQQEIATLFYAAKICINIPSLQWNMEIVAQTSLRQFWNIILWLLTVSILVRVWGGKNSQKHWKVLWNNFKGTIHQCLMAHSKDECSCSCNFMILDTFDLTIHLNLSTKTSNESLCYAQHKKYIHSWWVSEKTRERIEAQNGPYVHSGEAPSL